MAPRFLHVIVAFGVACVASLCGPTGALAADASHTFAVMSLIGDSLSVVRYAPSIGSSFDRNVTEPMVLKHDHFDRLALTAAGDAIRRSVAGADTHLLLTSDPKTYDSAAAPIDSSERLKALLDPIAAQVRDGQPKYLLIVTKFRSDARLAFADGAIGRGKLRGLGYYLDYETTMRDLTTNETTVGFMAPFAYLTVSLVDLSADRIVRSESATLSSVAEGRSSDIGGPWERTSPADKVQALDGLIRRAIDDIVPRLLTAG